MSKGRTVAELGKSITATEVSVDAIVSHFFWKLYFAIREFKAFYININIAKYVKELKYMFTIKDKPA